MRKNNNEKKKMIIWICLLFALVLGIGYAVLTEKISVDGTINYGAMAWDVGFSSVTDGGGTITSTPTLSNDKTSITVSCNIGVSSKSETCIVKAKVKNASTFIVELESNPQIIYDSTYINSVTVVWTSSNINVTAGDFLATNSEGEIQITITTKELTKEMLPSSSLSIPITISMDWIETDEPNNRMQVLVSPEDFIVGCYYNNGTLKNDTKPFSQLKTIEGFIEPQKIRIVIEDTENDVSSQAYKVIYSAYDGTGKILNPNDSANAMFNIENGYIDLDLVNLYPTGSKFKVDIFIMENTQFKDMPTTAQITVYSLENVKTTPTQSVFANKKIDILGDSITSQAKYIPTLQTLTEASNIVNHGMSGNKITEFTTRVNSIDADADLIIVFGGTNDYWHKSTEIGQITDTTNETFYGALNMIYDTLITNYPNAEYLFIAPPPQTYDGKDETHDFGYGTLNDFRNAMQAFASNKGVKFYNLGNESAWNPATHTSDGVHPNADGGVLLANLIYQFIQNNF